jgi:hypothetical protein
VRRRCSQRRAGGRARRRCPRRCGGKPGVVSCRRPRHRCSLHCSPRGRVAAPGRPPPWSRPASGSAAGSSGKSVSNSASAAYLRTRVFTSTLMWLQLSNTKGGAAWPPCKSRIEVEAAIGSTLRSSVPPGRRSSRMPTNRNVNYNS